MCPHLVNSVASLGRLHLCIYLDQLHAYNQRKHWLLRGKQVYSDYTVVIIGNTYLLGIIKGILLVRCTVCFIYFVALFCLFLLRLVALGLGIPRGSAESFRQWLLDTHGTTLREEIYVNSFTNQIILDQILQVTEQA